MWWFLSLVQSLLLFSCGAVIEQPYNCKTVFEKILPTLGEVAGVGFDNLQNIEMATVVASNYTLCKTTDDGRFLVPNSVTVFSIKNSALETSSTLFEHYDNFTSIDSRSINISPGFSGVTAQISGKFSYEYETMKSRQIRDKTETVQLQSRHMRYRVQLEMRTELHPSFKKRLERIAAYLLTDSTERAIYDTQVLIRDYGTHVVTKAELGASLVKMDQYMDSKESKYLKDKSSIEIAAKASFTKPFDKTQPCNTSKTNDFSLEFGYDVSTLNEMIDEYNRNTKRSEVNSRGGGIFSIAKSDIADIWSSSIETNLVVLDRAGEPIYNFINEDTLPDLPYPTLQKLYQLVKSEGVKNYYEHNIIRGCTEVTSANFNSAANVDDGTCKPSDATFSFGGLFQKCNSEGPENVCEGITNTNTLTGSNDCPSGFESRMINKGTKTKTKQEVITKWCLGLWPRCEEVVDVKSTAYYEAYWCSSTTNSGENELLFGGLYTPFYVNLKTRSYNCPPHFYKVTILDQLTVCLSQDAELAGHNSFPFGGFYSCKEGNPLAAGKDRPTDLPLPHQCPQGFSQHLAYDDSGCEINYCIRAGAVLDATLPKVQRPPYMDMPSVSAFTKTGKEDIAITEDGDIIDLDENANSPQALTAGKDLFEQDEGDTNTASTGKLHNVCFAAVIMYFLRTFYL